MTKTSDDALAIAIALIQDCNCGYKYEVIRSTNGSQSMYQ